MQIPYVFCSNSPNGFPAGPTNGNWIWPGNALTGNVFTLHATTQRVTKAIWTLVWNPNIGAGYNSVRLVMMDDGPTNIVQLGGWLDHTNRTTPCVDQGDLTAAVNTLLSNMPACGYKHIGMQINTGSQALIYKSTLDLVWPD